MANVSRETLENTYDVVVIGAGLSGCESAALLNSYDLRTLIVNISMDNPAFIKSVNKIILKDNKNFRIINRYEKFFFKNIKKTALLKKINSNIESYIIDKKRFSLNYKAFLETCKKIDTRQGLVERISKNDGLFKICLNDGENYNSKYIIVSCGTFFNAYTVFGTNKIPAGRNGEISSISLPENLKKHGLKFDRMMSFIPAAVDKKNIKKNENYIDGSFNATKKNLTELFALKTFAQKRDMKDILIDRLLQNKININRLTAEKIVFMLYPEAKETKEYVIENFFSSKNETIQEKGINKINCLEEAIMTRPSYIIEHDGIKENLTRYLEAKTFNDLYFPGEINGTKDYVEIALQGILAAADIINKYYKKELISLEK